MKMNRSNVLSNSVFRSLWIAATVSNVGTWMQDVGAGWLMTSLTHSPFLVSLVQSSVSLPMCLLAIPAGALADRVDRRKLVIYSQAWMTLAAGTLALLAYFHWVTPFLLLSLSVSLGVGSALTGPAWQAILPELVLPDQIPQAVALNGVAINLARALGPALAGIAIAASGPWLTFLCNSISFLGVIVVLLRWKREYVKPSVAQDRFWESVLEGLQFGRSTHALRNVLIRTFLFIFGASPLFSLLPVVGRMKLNLQASQYGLLMTLMGSGALFAALGMPKLRNRFDLERLLMYSTALFAAAIYALGHVSQLWVLCLVMAVGGMMWLIQLSTLNTAAILSAPHSMRARAASLYFLAIFGSFGAGSALWGLIATHANVSYSLTCASVSLLVGLFVSVRFPLQKY